MKKILVLAMTMVLILVTGCSSQNSVSENKIENETEVSKQDAYSDIPLNTIMNIVTTAEINGNPSDSSELYTLSTEVALIQITSIDGGDNHTQVSNEYICPFTYGKMNVLKVYKGNIEIGSTVGYVRQGGIIPFDDYLQSLYPEQRSKLERNMGSDKPAYVEVKFEDDINVEVGKNYIVYLKSYSDYSVEGLSVFSVIGWQGGLREVQGNVKARTGVKVYNNFTGEWETVEEVIPN